MRFLDLGIAHLVLLVLLLHGDGLLFRRLVFGRRALDLRDEAVDLRLQGAQAVGDLRGALFIEGDLAPLLVHHFIQIFVIFDGIGDLGVLLFQPLEGALELRRTRVQRVQLFGRLFQKFAGGDILFPLLRGSDPLFHRAQAAVRLLIPQQFVYHDKTSAPQSMHASVWYALGTPSSSLRV